MKKTVQSMMTAAMFAAAASAALSAMPESSQAEAAESGYINATQTEIQDVYGPPPMFETEETEIIQEETTDLTTSYDPSVMIMPVLYGPPITEETTQETTALTDPEPEPLYGPPPKSLLPGDFDHNRRVDARDLSFFKRMLMNGGYEDSWIWGYAPHVLDLDSNGTFDIEDIKVLRRTLTGRTESEPEESWPGPEFHVYLRIVPYFSDEADQLSDAERAERIAKANENLRNMTSFQIDYISGGQFMTGGDRMTLEVSEPAFGMTFDIPVENISEIIPEGTTLVPGELRMSSFGLVNGTEMRQCDCEMKYYQYVKTAATASSGYYYDKVYVEYDASKRKFKIYSSLKPDEDVPEVQSYEANGNP